MSKGKRAEYSVRVCCTNCGAEERVTLPVGQKIGESPCPTCGCETLRKGNSLTSGYRV